MVVVHALHDLPLVVTGEAARNQHYPCHQYSGGYT